MGIKPDPKYLAFIQACIAACDLFHSQDEIEAAAEHMGIQIADRQGVLL